MSSSQQQQKLTFAPASAFHSELRKRVDAYFDDNGISRSANAAMVLKTIFWFSWAWGGLALLLVLQPSYFPLQILLWLAIGFGLATIGFNIGHDAIHGAYSDKKWVNGLLSWSFDLMGASSFTWKVAHNVIHHTYTNIPGVDQDLEPGPTLIFYPQKTRGFHRAQHVYAWFLYCFIGIIWVYIKDFEQIRRADPSTGKNARFVDVLQLLAGKAIHIGSFLVLPLIILPQPFYLTVLGYTLMLAAGGFTLAIVFQLAHCIEGVQFPRAGDDNKMGDAWCEHQMRTTANFGTTPLSTFVCGGLDHQIEHHLMPRICHIHYRALAPIVKKCAEDHGLPYIHNGSFPNAVLAHGRTLKRLGRGEVEDVSFDAVPAE